MIDFTTHLKQEVDQNIRSIESGDLNTLNRALMASKMLEEKFDQLKSFISRYAFSDEEEEIRFFKEIKPRIFCHLLYYRKVYNIEMNRPVGAVQEQTRYLNAELEQIRQYIGKRLDFYRYVRCGATHLDREYFLRGRPGIDSQYLDSFYFERDPDFSTNGDFRLARILANDMLQVYLRQELELAGKQGPILDQTSLPGANLPRWTDKKNALIEILSALDEMGCVENGNLSLNRLASHFEFAFDISLGNVTRAFHEMKYRNNPTSFLDQMREALMRRLNDNESRYIKKITKK